MVEFLFSSIMSEWPHLQALVPGFVKTRGEEEEEVEEEPAATEGNKEVSVVQSKWVSVCGEEIGFWPKSWQAWPLEIHWYNLLHSRCCCNICSDLLLTLWCLCCIVGAICWLILLYDDRATLVNEPLFCVMQYLIYFSGDETLKVFDVTVVIVVLKAWLTSV